jgi:hypothetical protein
MREMRNCDSVMFFLDETYLNDAYLTSEVLVFMLGVLGLT